MKKNIPFHENNSLLLMQRYGFACRFARRSYVVMSVSVPFRVGKDLILAGGRQKKRGCVKKQIPF